MLRTYTVLIRTLTFILSLSISVNGEIHTDLNNAHGHGELLITELMAIDSILADEDGDFSDWIEILNSGSMEVNLKGWHLTDSPNDLTRWTFPDVTVSAGGYLVVFASDKDRRNPGSQLHTNFRLSASGEYLALVEPDGVTVAHEYAPRYPDQHAPKEGFSYGLAMDPLTGVSRDDMRFFREPTPGSANKQGVLGFVVETKFSFERGFYNEPFEGTITTTTRNAVIRYTTDGTTPTADNGYIYNGPIKINTTTMLRAAAYKPDFEPTAVVTHTYIFLDDVITQTRPPAYPSRWGGGVSADYDMDPDVVNHPLYRNTIHDDLKSLPAMSIVTDPANLFDPSRGIYVNPERKGVAWERPASTELIYPDGRKGFQINNGLRIQGGYSRIPDRKKHSFRLLFKRQYGPPTLRYPLFKDSPVDRFDTVVLRGTYNYSWHSHEGGFGSTIGKAEYLRDEFSRRTQLATGQPASHGTFVHLYLNGLYWGIYNLCERPDDAFSAEHLGGEKEEWDVISGGTRGINTTQIKAGNKTAWNTMMSLAERSALATDEKYQEIRKYVDVDNLIDYMLVIYYTGNRDAPTIIGGGGTPWNFYSARRRIPNAGFRFFAWDSEWTLEENTVNVVNFHNGTDNPARVFQKLKVNEDFRMLAADHIHRHFFNGGALTPEASIPRYSELANTIDRAIVGESARWGDTTHSIPRTRDANWVPEKNRIRDQYLPLRTGIVLQQLRNANLYPSTPAPVFSQHGGNVEYGFQLTMSVPGLAESATNSSSSDIGSGPAVNLLEPDASGLQNRLPVYYTTDGADPRVSGGRPNTEEAKAYIGPISLTGNVHIKARTYVDGTWSALNEATFDVNPRGVEIASAKENLRITEFMYNPPGGSDFEFIELHNTHSSAALPLDGLTFTGGINFAFPEATEIQPGGYLLVVSGDTDQVRAAFREHYGLDNSTVIVGPYSGELSNEGDRITLKGSGEVGEICSFEYSAGRGWPLAANGAGHSLVPLASAMDAQDTGSLNYGGNWSASYAIGGSPGKLDLAPSHDVVLNEILANPDGESLIHLGYDSNNWIEIYNPTSTSVVLRDWYLSDDIDDLKKWALPSIEIGPMSHVSFDELFEFDNPLGNGFGSSKNGNGLFLSYLPGFRGVDRVVDSIRFEAQERELSIGRYPDAGAYWYAMKPSRRLPNTPGILHVVIDEVMYHPAATVAEPSDNTAHEYIELFNPTQQQVDLWNASGVWRLDGGVGYSFPANTFISGGGRLLIVGFDPSDSASLNAFRNAYNLTSLDAQVVGPYLGNLSNIGGRIALEKPQARDQESDQVAWVIVDEVIFFNQSPWTPLPDGTGDSLQRISVHHSANNPTNWTADTPTPGRKSNIDASVDLWTKY